jgi:hypothetical protein
MSHAYSLFGEGLGSAFSFVWAVAGAPGGLARCVSAGSCGVVVVRDRFTRWCMGPLGGCLYFRLLPVIVCFAGFWAWWGFRSGLGIEAVVLCSLPVCWPGLGWSVLPDSYRPGSVCGLLLTLLCLVFVCLGDGPPDAGAVDVSLCHQRITSADHLGIWRRSFNSSPGG